MDADPEEPELEADDHSKLPEGFTFDLQQHLWGLHQENAENSKSHEELRAKATGFTFAVATLLGSVIAATKSGNGNDAAMTQWTHSVLSLLMMLTGGFGAILALKHHERSRFFVRAADVYREELERLAKKDWPDFHNGPLWGTAVQRHRRETLGTDFDLSKANDDNAAAKDDRQQRIREGIKQAGWLEALQVYSLWMFLNLSVAILGMAMLIITVLFKH